MLNEDLNNASNNNKDLDYDYEDFGDDDGWEDYGDEDDYNDGEWDEIDDVEADSESVEWEDS